MAGNTHTTSQHGDIYTKIIHEGQSIQETTKIDDQEKPLQTKGSNQTFLVQSWHSPIIPATHPTGQITTIPKCSTRWAPTSYK